MLPSNKRANDDSARSPKCFQSHNAGPMLRTTKPSQLIRGIQPADLPC